MTHQTKSVRSNAEAVNPINPTIPTFDEVYADPYVQASLKFLVENNSIEYPMLAPYADDIRQEMLIYLAKRLPSYDPNKSGIRTFCRMLLQQGLCRARRYYFTDTQKSISLAVPLDVLSECKKGDSISMIDIPQTSDESQRAAYPFEISEKREAVLKALQELSPKDQRVAIALMDGMSRFEIVERRICSNSRDLLRNVLPHIRAALKRNFF